MFLYINKIRMEYNKKNKSYTNELLLSLKKDKNKINNDSINFLQNISINISTKTKKNKCKFIL